MEREFILEYLTENRDEKYRVFHSKLIPGVDDVIGVRLPTLRLLAKDIAKSDYTPFLDRESYATYEERMLYGLVLGAIKDYDITKKYLKRFVHHIDNWAVCDSLCSSLKITKKHREDMLSYLLECARGNDEYVIRFGVVMLMWYYNDSEHIDLLLAEFDKITDERYYVKMAIAWAISMCYVKNFDKTLEYLKKNNLNRWTHNKAIQKIVESNQPTPENKSLARTFKRV